MIKKIDKKLIRDKIPEIIIKNNETPITRILDDREYLTELAAKIHEEADEVEEVIFEKEKLIEELADIKEILDTILNFYHVSNDELIKIQTTKREKRGGFSKKLYLERVENNHKYT